MAILSKDIDSKDFKIQLHNLCARLGSENEILFRIFRDRDNTEIGRAFDVGIIHNELDFILADLRAIANNIETD